MRISASGVGKTIEEALVKVRAELLKGTLHASEARVTEIAGQKIIDPENQSVENKSAASMESAIYTMAQHMKPVDGYLFRVLVGVNEDGVNSFGKVEVDLIRA